MSDLIFREKDHVYLLDGVKLPCVSDLCRFLHREIYKDVPVWQMENAALRGTAVHAATQALDDAGSCDIAEEYLPHVQAYKAFLQEHSVSWQMTEKALYHPVYRYAGTIDRYGAVDDLLTLVDIKTTYTVYKPLCRAQLNLYRLMLAARGYAVDRLCILHLQRTGKYRIITIDFDEALPRALITLHSALLKRKRKGGNYV